MIAVSKHRAFCHVRGVFCMVCVGLAVGMPAAGASPSPCDSARERFEAAQQAGDLAAMRDATDRLSVVPGCDDDWRAYARGMMARTLANSAREEMASGASLTSQVPTLEQALRYGPEWRAAAWLGDAAFEENRFQDAARRYEEALMYINDEAATPSAPPENTIAYLFHRAEITRLASTDYPASPRTRSGVPSGLGRESVRGFKPKKVAVPVRFAFGSAEFTDDGLRAAEDLLDSLSADGMPPITLVGHTDPVGSDAANQSLSERRAEALRVFLVARGYTGTIRVDGRGESEPLRLNERAQFTRDQFHQMLRRVEVVR